MDIENLATAWASLSPLERARVARMAQLKANHTPCRLCNDEAGIRLRLATTTNNGDLGHTSLCKPCAQSLNIPRTGIGGALKRPAKG